MDHHNVTFGRFKKSIKKSKGDELRNLFILLNNLQLYRNFSDVRSILTDFDSEKPEIWLGSLLCDSQKQEILAKKGHFVNDSCLPSSTLLVYIIHYRCQVFPAHSKNNKKTPISGCFINLSFKEYRQIAETAF